MNILTIDLDFLMPQLSNYNFVEFDKSKESPEEYWVKFKKTNNFKLNIDMSAYYFLTEIIQGIKDNMDKYQDKVCVLESHQDILNIIKDSKVNVVNIDHHHDIYYDFMGKNIAGDDSMASKMESCWVFHLYVKQQLLSYKWVANANSKFETHLLKYPFSFYIEQPDLYMDRFGIELEIENYIKQGKYDKIVFIESPYYLPKTKDVNKIIEDIKTILN